MVEQQHVIEAVNQAHAHIDDHTDTVHADESADDQHDSEHEQIRAIAMSLAESLDTIVLDQALNASLIQSLRESSGL